MSVYTDPACLLPETAGYEFPLSFQQERLWAAEEIAASGSAYNIALALRISGVLDLHILQRSLDLLVARHEALRTCFRHEGEETQQFVLLDAKLAADEVTLENHDALDASIASFVAAPFDFACAPLARARVLRESQDSAVLVLIFHHLIFDGGSASVFLRELSVIYQALLGNDEVRLPEVQLQYGDYSVWQRENTESAEIDTSLRYWRDLLKDTRPSEFSTDFPRAPVPSLQGDRVWRVLPDALHSSVSRACEALCVTPSIFSLAVFQVLIARYTASPQVLLGMSVSNRDRTETAGLIGFLVNMVPIRGDLSGNPAFSDLVRATSERAYAALSHQEVPWRELTAHGTPKVAFSFQPAHPQKLSFAGMSAIPVETNTGSSKFEISLLATRSADETCVSLEYNTALFERATAERMLEAYIRLIAAFSRDVAARIHSLPLFAEEVAAQAGIPVERVEALSPVTPTQRDLLVGSLTASDPGAYNLVASVSLGSNLDAHRWMDACRQAALQGGVSQLRFAFVRGEALQFIDRCAEVSVEVRDVTDVAALIAAELAVPVDLLRGPVVRYLLARDSSGASTALIAGHHVVFDAHSAKQFFTVAAEIYEDGQSREDAPQFVSYAAEAIATFDTAETVALWNDRMRAVVPLGRAKQAAERRPTASTATLSGAQLEVVRAAADKLGCSVPNLILSALGIVVESTQQPGGDFVIDNIVSGRPSKYRRTQGCFYRVLPRLFERVHFRSAKLRPFVRAQQQYRRRLQGREQISLLTQRRLSGEDWLRFVYNYYDCAVLETGGQRRRIRCHERYPADEVHLTVEDLGDCLELCAHYDRAQYTDHRVLERLLHVLDSFARLCHHEHAELPSAVLPDEVEKVSSWNEVPVGNTTSALALDVIAGQCVARAAATAVRTATRAWTYADLWRRSANVAANLRAAGVKPEEPVIVLADRDLELVAALLGVMRSGAAYVPVDPRQPSDRLASVLEQSRARIVLATTQYSGLLQAGGEIQVLDLDAVCGDLEDPLSLRGFEAVAVLPEQLAYIIYTSGSTGRPKGAMLHHAGMTNHLLAKVSELSLTPSSVVIECASQSFDVSIWQFLAVLLAGGQVYIADDEEMRDPAALFTRASSERATVLEIVPSQLRYILDEVGGRASFELSRLEWLIVNGEMLDWELCRRWLELYPAIGLLNAYGPTECSDDVTHQVVRLQEKDSADHNVWIGTRLQNLRLYIVDDAWQLVPIGATGELCVGGVGVGRGYLGEPALTAASYIPDPFSKAVGARLYRTGDRARYRAEARIECLGRMDNQVKVRGNRIELGEIEAALCRHPAIAQAIAEVRPDESGDPQIVCFILLTPESAKTRPSESDYRGYLSQRLPEYMIPAAIVTLECMPLNHNGKVDRKQLTWDPRQHNANTRSDDRPIGEMEEQIAQVWCEILSVPSVGRTQSFFSLGGHSLDAIRMISRVRDRLGISVRVREFWKNPTIAATAISSAASSAQQQRTSIRAIPRVAEAADWRADLDAMLACLETEGHAARWNCYPLSLAQQRLWTLAKVNPASAAYNIPEAIQLRGSLNVNALELALSDLVQRHEILRTTFHSAGDVSFQYINPPANVLLGAVAACDAADLQERLRAEASQPFSLSTGFPLRCKLFQLAPDEHVLLFVLHHIIADGSSMRSLMDDLSRMYQDRRRGLTPSLEPLGLQYVDYAVWNRRQASPEQIADQVSYWTQQLAGATKLVFPRLKDGANRKAERGACRSIRLSHEIRQACERVCRDSGVTPFSAMLSVFQLLVGRYCRQSDVLVYTPVTQRSDAGTEGMAGFFANVALVRSRLDGNPTFLELCAAVAQACGQAFANQSVPFETLVTRVGLREADGEIRGLQAGFSYRQEPVGSFALEGLSVEALDVELPAAKQDLAILVDEQPDGFRVTAEYRVAAFSDEDISMLLRGFETACRQLLVDPSARVSSVPLFCEETAAQAGIAVERIASLGAVTPVQRHLLSRSLASPMTSAYHIAATVELGPDLDEGRWIDACREAALRGGVSQLRFTMVRGEVQQFIDRGAELSIERRNVSDVGAFLEAELAAPIDVVNGPVIRHVLIRDSSGEYHGTIVGHQAALDRHSAERFLESVTALYQGREAGAAAPNIFDYTALALARGDTRATVSLWEERLRTLSPLGRFQEGVERRPVLREATLAVPQLDSIQQAADAFGCSVPDLLLSALAIVVEATQQPEGDFIVEKITADRSSTFAETQGCCIRAASRLFTRALFADGDLQALVSTDESWPISPTGHEHTAGWLRFAYEYRRVPTDRDSASQARVRIAASYPPDEVRLLVEQSDSVLRFAVQFDEGQMLDSRLLERLVHVIAQLVADGLPATVMPTAVLPDELEKLSVWSRGPAVTGATHTASDLISAQARENGKAVAIICGGSTINFEQLDVLSSQIAHLLIRKGVLPGDRVGVMLPRDGTLVPTLLGVWKAGACYVPLDPEYPADRLDFMLLDAAVRLVVTRRELVTRTPSGAATLLIDECASDINQQSDKPPLDCVRLDAMAYIIYTSGSTGRPKGVMVSHSGLANYLHWAVNTYDVAGGAGAPVQSPVGFDLTITSMFAPLVAGRPVFLAAEASAAAMLAESVERRSDYSLLKITPAHLDLLQHCLTPKRAGAAAKVFVIGGEALRSETLRFWREHAPATRLFNEYGPTETVVGCCVYEVPPGADTGDVSIPIGFPIANTQLYVLDRRGQQVPIGTPGELCIGGDGVAYGYWQRPELTAERFVPDAFGEKPGARLYRSGDLVRYRTDGILEYLGRVDHEVKLRGFRIDLGEIEAVLAQHATVQEAAVVVVGESGSDRRLIAYVVPPQGETPQESTLRAYVASKLPEYMAPSEYRLLSALPLTPNGKVDRKAIAAQSGSLLDARTSETCPDAPRTDLEIQVADIWKRVLGLQSVGRQQSFFTLGGHSLQAVRLLMMLRTELSIDIPLQTIFAAPTVEGIAAHIAETRRLIEQVQSMSEQELDGILSARSAAV